MANYGITNEQIGIEAPSALASAPSGAVSKQYAFIPTTTVVDDLRDNGWYPVSAQEAKVRKTGKQGFQKHLITFRNESALNQGLKEIGDTIPEILLTNSHDARNSFQLFAGLFRMVCANGMVVADESFGKMSITHRGYNVQTLQDTLGTYLENLPRTIESVNRFKEINLVQEQQVDFAKQAYELAYSRRKSSFDPVELLRVQRDADRGDDLWRVFNRIQENVVKAGIEGKTEKGRRTRTRAITSIDNNITINKQLFDIANNFATVA